MKKNIIVAMIFTFGICMAFCSFPLHSKLLWCSSLIMFASGIFVLFNNNMRNIDSCGGGIRSRQILWVIIVFVSYQVIKRLLFLDTISFPYSSVTNSILWAVITSIYFLSTFWLAHSIGGKIEAKLSKIKGE